MCPMSFGMSPSCGHDTIWPLQTYKIVLETCLLGRTCISWCRPMAYGYVCPQKWHDIGLYFCGVQSRWPDFEINVYFIYLFILSMPTKSRESLKYLLKMLLQIADATFVFQIFFFPVWPKIKQKSHMTYLNLFTHF